MITVDRRRRLEMQAVDGVDVRVAISVKLPAVAAFHAHGPKDVHLCRHRMLANVYVDQRSCTAGSRW